MATPKPKLKKTISPVATRQTSDSKPTKIPPKPLPRMVSDDRPSQQAYLKTVGAILPVARGRHEAEADGADSNDGVLTSHRYQLLLDGQGIPLYLSPTIAAHVNRGKLQLPIAQSMMLTLWPKTNQETGLLFSARLVGYNPIEEVDNHPFGRISGRLLAAFDTKLLLYIKPTAKNVRPFVVTIWQEKDEPFQMKNQIGYTLSFDVLREGLKLVKHKYHGRFDIPRYLKRKTAPHNHSQLTNHPPPHAPTA